MSKVLQLTLKKEWFDKILSGEKTVEYREVKRHWNTRLCGAGTMCNTDLSKVLDFVPRHFDYIFFRNGYAKDAPHFKIECKSITLQRNINTPLGKGDFFVIKLGAVIKDTPIITGTKLNHNSRRDA